MSLPYTELLRPTLKRTHSIDGYWGHIGGLGYIPSGDLLIIGVAADLMEVAMVERALGRTLVPEITSVTTVNEHNFNRDQITAATPQAIAMFEKAYPGLEFTVNENTTFQNLDDESQFDSILFIAAWSIFGSAKQYKSIPRLLKPGGNFVGTTDYKFEVEPDLKNLDCEIKIHKCHYDHPRVGRNFYWSKINIHKRN